MCIYYYILYKKFAIFRFRQFFTLPGNAFHTNTFLNQYENQQRELVVKSAKSITEKILCAVANIE